MGGLRSKIRLGGRPLWQWRKAAQRSLAANWLALRARVDPRLRFHPDASWLLILTFPNGGSSAVSDLIARSSRAMRLTDNCEGYRLVPELDRLPDRLLERPLVSAHRLRAIWLGHLPRASGSPFVVVEKSPDNMFRWKRVREAVQGMPVTAMILTRDPIATIASWVKRYGMDESPERWAGHFGIAAVDRSSRLRIWARLWLRRAERLCAIAPEVDLIVRYEDLCADPKKFLARLKQIVPLLSDIDPEARLHVKDYPPQPLVNMNEASVAFLSPADVAILREELAQGNELVKALGYRL